MYQNTKHYITENVLFYKKRLYFLTEDEKYICINTRNFFKYLIQYGWVKLNIEWRKKLDSANYCVLECGSDGDCLFHVISEALNLDLIFKNDIPKYSILDIRKIASNEINDDNFEIILESYKAELEYGEFIGDWNPNEINSKDDLKKEVEKKGDSFWGDHILLQLISKALGINFIIFDNNKNNIYSLFDNLKYEKTVYLYYYDNYHFQLIGHFNGKVINTVFDKKDIPEIILNLYYKKS